MKKKNHRHIRAWLLSCLLFFAFTAKELHHVFAHQHRETKICDARDGEQHLHDENYIPDDCSLCDFTFSTYDFTLPAFAITRKQNIAEKTLFAYISYISSKKHFFKQLRAPPAEVV